MYRSYRDPQIDYICRLSFCTRTCVYGVVPTSNLPNTKTYHHRPRSRPRSRRTAPVQYHRVPVIRARYSVRPRLQITRPRTAAGFPHSRESPGKCTYSHLTLYILYTCGGLVIIRHLGVDAIRTGGGGGVLYRGAYRETPFV